MAGQVLLSKRLHAALWYFRSQVLPRHRFSCIGHTFGKYLTLEHFQSIAWTFIRERYNLRCQTLWTGTTEIYPGSLQFKTTVLSCTGTIIELALTLWILNCSNLLGSIGGLSWIRRSIRRVCKFEKCAERLSVIIAQFYAFTNQIVNRFRIIASQDAVFSSCLFSQVALLTSFCR